MSTDMRLALAAALTVMLFITIATFAQWPRYAAPQPHCNWCGNTGERHAYIEYPDSPMPSYWALCHDCYTHATCPAEVEK